MQRNLTVLVVHDVHPGKLRPAAERINGNGDRMAQRPGFVDRSLYVSCDGEQKLATITHWSSLQAYEDWVAHNKEHNPHAGVPAPFGASPAELFYQYVPEETA